MGALQAKVAAAMAQAESNAEHAKEIQRAADAAKEQLLEVQCCQPPFKSSCSIVIRKLIAERGCLEAFFSLCSGAEPDRDAVRSPEKERFGQTGAIPDYGCS
jgi:hypothetical protein